MLNNVGSKIKGLAEVILTLAFVASGIIFILALVSIKNEGDLEFLPTFLMSGVVFLSGLFGSWFIYAFGEIAEYFCVKNKERAEQNKNENCTEPTPVVHNRFCKQCGNQLSKNAYFCDKCGTTIDSI